MRGERRVSVVQDGAAVLKGERSAFKKTWNPVKIGHKRIIVEKKSPPKSEGRFPLEDILLNQPFTKAEHRCRCSLCNLWFAKTSVKYKTSNYRIVEYRRKLGYLLEGRRYETPTWLYANADVCVFCSQFFDEKHEPDITTKDLTPPKIIKTPIVKTKLDRTNIATRPNSMNITNNNNNTSINKNLSSSFDMSLSALDLHATNTHTLEVYQSSTVDGREAVNALEPFIAPGAKTRREADPWWELDLGVAQNIHSIDITVIGGLQQVLEMYIMVLENRIGFENPFLDSTLNKAVAKCNYTLPLRDERTAESFTWKLPERFYGKIIRIQLRGLAVLMLQKIEIWQGDDVDLTKSVVFDPMNTASSISEDMNGLIDLGVTTNEIGFDNTQLELNISSLFAPDEEFPTGSFATLSPKKIKETMLFSPTRDMKTLAELDVERTGKVPKSSVDDLVAMSEKNANINALGFSISYQSATWFPKDELLAIREHIFEDLTGSKGKPSTTFLTADETDGTTSRSSPPQSRRSKREEEVNPYSYEELIGPCLKHSEPRISLDDLHTKLRQIMLQIDLKQNLKTLGPIGTSESFFFIAEDDEEQLRRLKSSFDFMEKQWDRQDSHNVIAAERRKKKNSNSSVYKPEPDVFPVTRGCSWAQLCIILHLMCMKQGRLVPANAYMITDFKGYGNDLFDPRNTEFDYDDKSSIALSQNDDIHDMMSLASAASGSVSEIKRGNSSPTNALVKASSLPELGPRARAALGLPPSLLETVRAKSDAPPIITSTFSEYRLGNLAKKVSQYPTFPKKLRADFMKLMIKPKKTTKIKDDVIDDEDTILLKSLEAKHVEPMVPLEALAATTKPFPDRKQELNKLIERKGKGSFFSRICALCEKKFPKDAMGNKVIFKHIIRLRREWDPSLIPKKLEMLEDGMGMYNLLAVCPFCSQFFDPDVDGGIAFPQQLISQGDDITFAEKVDQTSKKEKGKKFFDARYPLTGVFKEDFVANRETVKSRQGALLVRNVTAHLNYEMELAEEKRKEKANRDD